MFAVINELVTTPAPDYKRRVFGSNAKEFAPSRV